ncbi:MAG: Hsp20/alpha crystallin family protein [Chloroflexi bacterium]|nr:Hsp20/alpha crystallin family protein [Chloroflexota bacterium]
MTMMRWDPYREMLSLRQTMDRLFEDTFLWPARSQYEMSGGNLPLDIYQTKNDVVVKAALPGLKPEEVDISLSGETLTIKGEHREEKDTREADYIRREHRYGSFSRTVTIPVAIQSDKAQATFDNGILTLTLPKAEAIKPKQIKVKAKETLEGGKA